VSTPSNDASQHGDWVVVASYEIDHGRPHPAAALHA
jgi:hypothetical protein